VIIQSGLFPSLASVTLGPLTSEVRDDIPLLRMDVQPSVENGLQMPVQVAADRINTIAVSRISRRIGSLDEVEMMQGTRAVAVFLGIA
jgi:mRNA interferase MazF